jgi:hypothetical protein
MPFPSLSKAYAIGSASAAFFLTLMTLIPRPFTREDQIALWKGAHSLNLQDLNSLTSQFSLLFILVSLYLIGHFLMWLGYAFLIKPKSTLLSAALISIGLLSCLLDFSEYCMRGAMNKCILSQKISHASFLTLWWYVREMSIWMIYLGTSLIGIIFLRISKMAAMMALLGILTIPCLYLALSKIWFVWLIAWHAVSAVIIFRNATGIHKYL